MSFKIGDIFSVGGGPIYANGSVTFNRNVTPNPLLGNTNVNIEAKGITAWGYNVGFMFKTDEEITLGFDYRSEITMKARGGNATYNYEGNAIAPLNPALSNGTFNADLPFLLKSQRVYLIDQMTNGYLLLISTILNGVYIKP